MPEPALHPQASQAVLNQRTEIAATFVDLKRGLSWLEASARTFGLRLVLEGPLGGQPTLVIFNLPIALSAAPRSPP